MKFIIKLFIVFLPLFTYGQKKNYNISGLVYNSDNVKYAYLSTLSHQTTISSPQVFAVVPIINGKFQFKGTYDLEGKKYQYACLFIDARGNISKEELSSKFKQLVWVVGRENNFKQVVLEDLTIGIDKWDQLISSKILNGGLLTKQVEERKIASNRGDKKLVEFIKKYPNSPISFDTVSEINDLIGLSDADRLEAIWGTPKELFMALSKTLRSSKEGIVLRNKIENNSKQEK